MGRRVGDGEEGKDGEEGRDGEEYPTLSPSLKGVWRSVAPSRYI